MTEQTAERTGAPERTEERPRCEMGNATDKPCWREATEQAWELANEPLTVCAEHKRYIELGREADEHLIALDNMRSWIAATLPGPNLDILERHACTMREKAEREYCPVAGAEKAAGLIAKQPKGEKPLTQEQAERLAELMLRSDAFADAWAILEDLPEEMCGARSRSLMVAALVLAGEEANQARQQYKRELAIR